MTEDLYTGEIDWERIYRAFHDPADIAKRIQKELGSTNLPLIFSGFLETASLLANEMPVTFVDSSPSITDTAKKKHINIYEIHTGDITECIGSLPVSHVVIACRISAYWNSPEYFKRLAASLLSFPREVVLIDFFDKDLVNLGDSRGFENKGEIGNWEFIEFEENNLANPSFFKARLKVSYSLSDHAFSYDGYRSFFRKAVISNWADSNFSGYDVILGEPLLDQDPGFLLKLIRKKE